MALKTILLAFIFGFIGGMLGFLSAWAFVRSTTPNANAVAAITRAHLYELVDREGRTIGRWGSEADHAVAFTLFDQKGFKAAELSVVDGMRALEFMEGEDQWRRMSLVAAQLGIANLTLGDDFRQGRLTLGAFDDSDLASGGPRQNWGLVVRGRGITWVRLCEETLTPATRGLLCGSCVPTERIGTQDRLIPESRSIYPSSQLIKAENGFVRDRVHGKLPESALSGHLVGSGSAVSNPGRA